MNIPYLTGITPFNSNSEGASAATSCDVSARSVEGLAVGLGQPRLLVYTRNSACETRDHVKDCKKTKGLLIPDYAKALEA